MSSIYPSRLKSPSRKWLKAFALLLCPNLVRFTSSRTSWPLSLSSLLTSQAKIPSFSHYKSLSSSHQLTLSSQPNTRSSSLVDFFKMQIVINRKVRARNHQRTGASGRLAQTKIHKIIFSCSPRLEFFSSLAPLFCVVIFFGENLNRVDYESYHMVNIERFCCCFFAYTATMSAGFAYLHREACL